MLGVIFGYVTSYLFDKMAVVNIDPLIGPLFRRLPSLLLGIVLLFAQGMTDQLKPSSSRFVGKSTIMVFALAGAMTTAGMFAYYYALLFGGVVITIPISQTLVLWGTIVGWVYLKERFSSKAAFGIIAVCVGLALLGYGQSQGVVVSDKWFYAIPLALVSAVAWGASGVLWRDGQLRGAHQSTAILLQFGVGIGLTILVLAVMGRLGSITDAAMKDVLALFAGGILSGVVAIYCMFTALRLMSVARVYALNSLTPLLAAVLAYFFLGEFINGLMLVGIVLISIGAGLVQIYKPAEEKST
jgi:drug/metabolite transporter (DMT)-like permease